MFWHFYHHISYIRHVRGVALTPRETCQLLVSDRFWDLLSQNQLDVFSDTSLISFEEFFLSILVNYICGMFLFLIFLKGTTKKLCPCNSCKNCHYNPGAPNAHLFKYYLHCQNIWPILSEDGSTLAFEI